MKNKFKKISLIFLSAVLLSACSLNKENMETNTPEMPSTTVTISPTPTIGKDNSIDSIESDLKETTILEESFSDIK